MIKKIICYFKDHNPVTVYSRNLKKSRQKCKRCGKSYDFREVSQDEINTIKGFKRSYEENHHIKTLQYPRDVLRGTFMENHYREILKNTMKD